MGVFDLRKALPLTVKDHMYDAPIVDIKFHTAAGDHTGLQRVISADCHIVKVLPRLFASRCSLVVENPPGIRLDESAGNGKQQGCRMATPLQTAVSTFLFGGYDVWKPDPANDKWHGACLPRLPTMAFRAAQHCNLCSAGMTVSLIHVNGGTTILLHVSFSPATDNPARSQSTQGLDIQELSPPSGRRQVHKCLRMLGATSGTDARQMRNTGCGAYQAYHTTIMTTTIAAPPHR